MNVSLQRFPAVFALILTCIATLASQRQAENWHFGSGVAISFIDGVPALLTNSSMETTEGATAYSGEGGNLLFYTNGGGRNPATSEQSPGIIWNRNHEVMYDMMGTEGGGFSARQSAIAFSVPGSETEYYLFTMEELEFDVGGSVPEQPEGRGLSYFIIDMTLNGGLGGVSLADQRVYVPTYEGLSATPMTDGSGGHWVIALLAENNGFVVVPVTTEGVGQPVEIPVNAETGGQIKISPDGRTIFNAGRLYDFDPADGTLVEDPAVSFSGINALTTSFTPDSRYLFTVRTVEGSRSLTRFDLSADDVLASAANLSSLGTGVTFQMQIGPNGNLYFLDFSQQSNAYGLSEIECPSTAQPSLNRQLIDLTIDEFVTFTGLPNYVDAIFAEPEATADTVVVSNQNRGLCPGGSLELSAAGYGDSYNWSNGDTGRVITVTEVGDYRVTITGGCTPRVEDFPVRAIEPLMLALTPLEGAGICPGDTVEFVYSTQDSILGVSWPDGSEGDSFRALYVPGDSVVLRVGTVCGRERVVYIFPPENELTAELFTDFSNPLCPGDEVAFTVSGNFIDRIIWQDSTEDTAFRTIAVDSTVTYTANVFSVCGDSILLTADLDYSFCPLECDAEIPTLITPNRDGMNDGFRVFTNCDLEEYTLRVFNRWGQEVFVSDNPDEIWDGTREGEIQPMDIYLYRVQFRFPNNPDLEQRDGQFTLVR